MFSVVVGVALLAGPDAAGHGAGLVVSSPAFEDGGELPRVHTCDADNVPPEIAWSQVPGGTASIAVLVEESAVEPAPFTHWLVVGIPADARGLAAVPDGAVEVEPYNGPCPLEGAHRYQVHVYALDVAVSAADRAGFARASYGHVLAHGVMTATYEKAILVSQR